MRSRILSVLVGLAVLVGVGAMGSTARAADQDMSRYRFQNGEWWYLMPSGAWVYYRDGRWQDFDPSTYSPPAVASPGYSQGYSSGYVPYSGSWTYSYPGDSYYYPGSSYYPYGYGYGSFYAPYLGWWGGSRDRDDWGRGHGSGHGSGDGHWSGGGHGTGGGHGEGARMVLAAVADTGVKPTGRLVRVPRPRYSDR